MAFFTILVTLPLDSEMFEKGEKKDALDTSMFRNAISMFSRGLLFIVLFVIVEIFEFSFVSAAISMFVLMALNILLRVKGFRSFKKSI